MIIGELINCNTIHQLQITQKKTLEQQLQELDLTKDSDLSKKEIIRLQEFLEKYIKIMAKNTISPGFNLYTKHKIDTGNVKPIYNKLRRTSEKEDEMIRAEIKKMLDNGVVRKSESPWAAPVVLVRKKDGTIRFCVDFRKFNEVTINDQYPLPHADSLSMDLLG